jgi:hypothetical protein
MGICSGIVCVNAYKKPPCGMYDCELLSVQRVMASTCKCKALDIATEFGIIKTYLEMNASKSETRRHCH